MELKKGEELCKECGGSGCVECNFYGKLDWIEKIVGPRLRKLKIKFTFPDEFPVSITQDIIIKMSKEMAKDLDKQFLEEGVKIINE